MRTPRDPACLIMPNLEKIIKKNKILQEEIYQQQRDDFSPDFKNIPANSYLFYLKRSVLKCYLKSSYMISPSNSVLWGWLYYVMLSYVRLCMQVSSLFCNC